MADEGSGWAISKTNSWLQELLKKKSCMQGEPERKNWSSAFFYPGLVFEIWKNFFHKLLSTRKKQGQPISK